MKFNKLLGFAALMAALTFGQTAFAADEITTNTDSTTDAETTEMVTNSSPNDVGPFFDKQKTVDHIIGSADAKVTIIEYASLTCPHCANFHQNTFKQFKTNYIDTGKVRFIYRNFHLDQLALAGTMLAQCAPEDQYFTIIDLLFTSQSQWVGAEKQFDEMLKVLKLVGYSAEKVNECFAQSQLVSDFVDDRQYASDILQVSATPTLFINEVKHETNNDYATFTAAVDAALAE